MIDDHDTTDGPGESEHARQTDDRADAASSLGVTIPDEHVGAFVAEALEDPERSGNWDDVVDAMVAPEARADWRHLSPAERAAAVLSKADDYDRRATEQFDGVALDADRAAVRAAIDEGLRCRRNADAFRNAVAAAYDDGLLDDEALLDALADADFETERIARREDALERVDDAYDVEFSPYGGTLLDTDDGPEPETDHPETW